MISTGFNSNLVGLARRARRFSQQDLANATAIAQGTISKIEKGMIVPSEELLEKISVALNFPACFFVRSKSLRPTPVSYHRKKSKLTVGDWESVLAKSEIYRFAIEEMLASVEITSSKLPPPFIDPDQYGGRMEEIAMNLRQQWMIPRGPIDDLTKIIEDAGVIIVPFDFGTDLIDGFCQHAVDSFPPMIFLNSRFKEKDRIRFSLAHELGHLIMHRMPCEEQEMQANSFASAFLMPAQDILPSLYGMSLEKIMTLKLYWKTSMQALIRRARDLGRISERGYKYYCIEMNKRGWRSKEPIEIPGVIENPITFKQLLKAHIIDLSYSMDELSNMFGLYPDEINDMFPLDRPRLRIVK